MESELLKAAMQLPFVAIVIGLVIWFVRIMSQERDKAATREQLRDQTFAAAMEKSADTFAKAIDRNTEVIAEFDRTITSLTIQGNHNGTQR